MQRRVSPAGPRAALAARPAGRSTLDTEVHVVTLSATPERRAGSGTFFLRCLWRASFRCQDPNLKLECSSAEFSESCRRRTKPKAPQRWAAERLLKPGHLHCPALQPELIKHTHCKRGSEQRPRLGCCLWGRTESDTTEAT